MELKYQQVGLYYTEFKSSNLMKKIILIILLGLSAYCSQAQVLRINKYLVDSLTGSGFWYLYKDTTHTGQWGLVNGGSEGGSGGSGTVNSGAQYRITYYATAGTAVSAASAITGGRALISDANGVPTHSTATATQLNYLSNVTSDVQTQLNGKQASGTYVTSVTGTSNRITIGGTATDPTVDISTSYVGQATITTLGTITTGTWSGTTIGVTKGGTGATAITAKSIWVANSANTITEVTPGAGQSIRINAGNTAWEAYTPGSGGSPAGSDREIQFNNAGAFGASSILKLQSDGYFRGTESFIYFTTTTSTQPLFLAYNNSGSTTGIATFENSNTGSGQTPMTFTFGNVVKGQFRTDKDGNMVVSSASNQYFGYNDLGSYSSALFGANILMGGTSIATSATKTFHLFNGTVPSASVTDGVLLYSEDVAASAELKVRDEAGNITVLGPHTFTGIPGGRSEEMAWAFYSEREGKYINVDMLKLARSIEKLTGEKLVYIGNTKDELPNKENK